MKPAKKLTLNKQKKLVFIYIMLSFSLNESSLVETIHFSLNCVYKSQNQLQALQQIMLIIVIILLVLILTYVAYRYYFRPKWELERYSKLLTELGYKVYVQKFTPFGISFMKDYEKGLKQHKDALYTEKHLYPHYDISIGNLFDLVIIFFNNPDLIKEFFAPEKVYIFPKIQKGVDAIKYFLGDGLVFSEGPVWRYKRNIISKLFTFDLFKESLTTVAEICDKVITKIEDQNKIDENTYSFQAIDLSSAIFNSVLMKYFFGTDSINEKVKDQPYDVVIQRITIDATAVSISPLTMMFGKTALKLGLTKQIRELKETMRIFRAITEEAINKRIAEVKSYFEKNQYKVSTDLVEALVYEQERAKKAGSTEYEYTNEYLLNEFCTFIVGGTDTTSHFFTMMVYLIVDHPHIEERFRRQIKEMFKTNEDFNFQNLKKFVYADWIQKETTRYYGPVNGVYVREATEDCAVANIPISKGMAVTCQPMANHYDTRVFKDPCVFRPERWESECESLHPFGLIGFSAGPKACLGKQLAYLQSKIALIKVFQRYEKIIIQPASERQMELRFLYQPNDFKTTFIKKVKLNS